MGDGGKKDLTMLCTMKLQHFYSFLGHILIPSYQALYIYHACSFTVVAFELSPWRIKAGKATTNLPFYYPAGKTICPFFAKK